jgi:hypothetical protein
MKTEIDERVVVLRTEMGLALWEAQGVEQIVAKYYAVVFKLPGTPSLEEIEIAFEDNFAHTAGKLIGLLKKASDIKDIGAEKLEHFVSERNWLVHKLRRQEFQLLKDKSEYEAVVMRVRSLSALSVELIKLFHNKLIEHFVQLGTPRDVIEREHARVLNEIYSNQKV